MADKTQLFPLEAHDAVRTRLTHSHEVSTLARSIGFDLVTRFGAKIGLKPTSENLRDVSSLLGAIGLVHDIGNPPFGHQGEAAIRSWFKANRKNVFHAGCNVPMSWREDFYRFEGNAQTLRLVTRLQLMGDDFGLNLSYGTLAALLKYTVTANAATPKAKHAGRHKPGFFRSEETIVKQVWANTGLRPGQRHPLTFLMEACDDIAYSVIDAEDTVKKDLASYADLRDYLSRHGATAADKNAATMIKRVLAYTDSRRETFLQGVSSGAMSPAELDDFSMQSFRVTAISEMVRSALDTFVRRYSDIASSTFHGDLIESSDASLLRQLLKDFLSDVAFPHREVLRIELSGSLVISQLMDRLWRAIVDRKNPLDPASGRNTRLSAYTYSRISENYRRVFENPSHRLPMRYKEAQLLTDMVAGMTDSFAHSLLRDLKGFES